MTGAIRDAAVVITGASSGIGRAAALEFARRGAKVTLAARSAEGLESARRLCESAGASAIAVRADVAVEKDVEALARRAVEAHGRIDAWVNNAAVMSLGGFLEVPPDAYRRIIETNLFGQIHGARASLRRFVDQGHGVLVNTSSLFGKMAAPNISAYVASKFAVEGLSESLRHEFAEHPGIHICTVLPGGVDTPIYQHAANYFGRSLNPLYPLVEPEKVAAAIVGCVERPKRTVRVGKSARFQEMLHNLWPSGYERLGSRFGAAVMFLDESAEQTNGNVLEPAGPWEVHGAWKGRRAAAITRLAAPVLRRRSVPRPAARRSA